MAKPIEQESDEADSSGEITLIDIVATLWHYKFLIIGITFVFAAYSVVYSVISLMLPPEESYLPNQFTVDADMLIKNSSSSTSSLSSALGEAAALAGIAGISLSKGATNSELAIYLCSSREFLDAVIEEFNLYEKFNFDPEKVKSPRSTARDMVSKMLSAAYDDDNGIFTVSCTNKDPEFAFNIVNFTVDYLEQKFLSLGVDENLLTKKNLEENIDTSFKEIQRLQQQTGEVERSVSNVYGPGSAEPISMKLSMIEMELSAQQEIYKQLKVQYELLKIEMASETPVFQILSRPEIPDMKSGPSRGKLCIIITFVGGCLSVLLSFAIEALGNLKNDEAVASKFKRRDGRGFSLFRRGRKDAPTIRLVRAHTESPNEDEAEDDEGGDIPKVSRQPSREAVQSTDADEDDTADDDDDTEQDEGDELEAEDDAEVDDSHEETGESEVEDGAGDEGEGSQGAAGKPPAKRPLGIPQESAVPKPPSHELPPPHTQPEQKTAPRHAERSQLGWPGGAQASATPQVQRPQRPVPPAPDRTTAEVRSAGTPRAPQGTGDLKRTVKAKPDVAGTEARVAPTVRATPSGTQHATLPQRLPLRTDQPQLKAKGDAKDAKEDLAKKRGKKDDKRDDKKGDKKRGKKDKD